MTPELKSLCDRLEARVCPQLGTAASGTTVDPLCAEAAAARSIAAAIRAAPPKDET